MKKKTAILAVVLFFLLSGCKDLLHSPKITDRGDYTPVKRYISSLIEMQMQNSEVRGLSIALVDDQRVVWAEGFGFADVAGKVAATPQTVYRAGAIADLFTATAAMQLAEQGKVDIDKPLRTYLPKFSIKSRFSHAAPITPRNLMTNHSGLPADFMKGMWNPHPEPFENVIEQIRSEYVAYPPDTVFSYSNLGFTLLGCMIERTSGRSYASYMDGAILSPLGMHHSSFSQKPDTSSLAAKAYREGEEVAQMGLRDVPAEGLNTSVDDLSRFIEMVFAGGESAGQRILRPRSVAQMLQPQDGEVALDLDFYSGLGWILGGVDIGNGGPVASHGGATLCHHSVLMILPEYKLGVVVLANSASAGEVVHNLATESLKLALEVKAGIGQPKKAKKPAELLVSQKKLQSYDGRYDTMAGIADITAEQGYLRVKALNKNLRLIPRADGLFHPEYRLLGLLPVSLGRLGELGISGEVVQGHRILVGHAEGQKFLIGEQLEPVSIPQSWLRRIGKYRCINRGDDPVLISKGRLRQDGGFLRVEYSLPLFTDRTMSVVVKPISDSAALVYGLGSGKGGTIRVVDRGGEELLQYSGYLFRKVGNGHSGGGGDHLSM